MRSEPRPAPSQREPSPHQVVFDEARCGHDPVRMRLFVASQIPPLLVATWRPRAAATKTDATLLFRPQRQPSTRGEGSTQGVEIARTPAGVTSDRGPSVSSPTGWLGDALHIPVRQPRITACSARRPGFAGEGIGNREAHCPKPLRVDANEIGPDRRVRDAVRSLACLGTVRPRWPQPLLDASTNRLPPLR